MLNFTRNFMRRVRSTHLMRGRYASGKNFDGINYFSVFDIPATFQIDQTALNDKFKKLQKHLHPDVQKARPESTPVSTGFEIDSSTVNHAYQVLRDPADRVRHLLEVLEISIPNTEELSKIPEICTEAFELREEIEAMRAKGDISDAAELAKAIAAKIEKEGLLLQQYISANNVESIKLSCARIIYLSKALDEVESVETDFVHMP